MKRFVTMVAALALMLGGMTGSTAFAQGRGGGGKGGRGQQTGPKDGSGKQQGKGQKAKKTGPRDGTGPIHTPPQK